MSITVFHSGVFLVLSLLPVTNLSAQTLVGAKVSGEVLYKIMSTEPEPWERGGVSVEVSGHAETACAVYVTEKLTPAELQNLSNVGVSVNAWAWVPPVPSRHPFGYYLARIGPGALESIAMNPRIVRVESVERRGEFLNDLTRAYLRVDDVEGDAGFAPGMGKGVKIAIADSGLDIEHPDIPRPIEAFDVTTGPTPATWSTDIHNTIITHGTHVTGTAVGSGKLSAGKYRGVAPEASLYFYKILGDHGVAEEDQIKAILRALEVGCDIFSLSVGTLSEFMDGSDPLCQAIDHAFDAGMLTFVAAGNDGVAGKHVSSDVPPGRVPTEVMYSIKNPPSPNQAVSEEIQLVWRDGTPDGNIRLACANCDPLLGEHLEQLYEDVSQRGTKVKVYRLTPGVAPDVTKTFSLQLWNDGVGASAKVHCFRAILGVGRFEGASRANTVTSPALADNAVAVGAWCQRREWTDWRGVVRNVQDLPFPLVPVLTPGTLAEFSGWGPRVDGTRKPDIAAPGAMTISTFDTGKPLVDVIDSVKVSNGGSKGPSNYLVSYGTSSATPAAAGAAALILESHPGLAAAELRSLLQGTADAASSPDNAAGYGLINVRAALGAWSFLRGDSNADRSILIGDALFTLFSIFGLKKSPPGCLEAMDSNDDGILDVSDAIYLLAYLFRAGPPPSPPFPFCSLDPTPDTLGCANPHACM